MPDAAAIAAESATAASSRWVARPRQKSRASPPKSRSKRLNPSIQKVADPRSLLMGDSGTSRLAPSAPLPPRDLPPHPKEWTPKEPKPPRERSPRSLWSRHTHDSQQKQEREWSRTNRAGLHRRPDRALLRATPTVRQQPSRSGSGQQPCSPPPLPLRRTPAARTMARMTPRRGQQEEAKPLLPWRTRPQRAHAPSWLDDSACRHLDRDIGHERAPRLEGDRCVRNHGATSDRTGHNEIIRHAATQQLARDVNTLVNTHLHRSGESTRPSPLLQRRAERASSVLDGNDIDERHKENQRQPRREKELDRTDPFVFQPPIRELRIQPTMSTPSAWSAPQITTSAAIASAALPISSAVFSPRSSVRSAFASARIVSSISLLSLPGSYQIGKGGGHKENEHRGQDGNGRNQHRRPSLGGRSLDRFAASLSDILR